MNIVLTFRRQTGMIVNQKILNVLHINVMYLLGHPTPQVSECRPLYSKKDKKTMATRTIDNRRSPPKFRKKKKKKKNRDSRDARENEKNQPGPPYA
jgi:hypothetical protein